MQFSLRGNKVLLDTFINIILIAITSIGIESFNTKENEKFKEQRRSNFIFLVLVLVYAILRLLLVTGIFAYQQFLGQNMIKIIL